MYVLTTADSGAMLWPFIWSSPTPVSSAAIRSKVMDLLLMMQCLLLLLLSWRVFVWSLFRYAVLCVISSFGIISQLMALLLLSS